MRNVNNLVRIDISALCKNSTVLSGAIPGAQLFKRLLDELPPEPVEPQPLLLDFLHIDVATASFLRESVIALRSHVRSRRSNFYPVIANAKSSVRDELLTLAKLGGPIMICTVTKSGDVTETSLIGSLDKKQKITLDLVTKLGEADATTLMSQHPDDEVTRTTAWNNRLSALTALSLLMEITEGRTKKYRPLFAGR